MEQNKRRRQRQADFYDEEYERRRRQQIRQRRLRKRRQMRRRQLLRLTAMAAILVFVIGLMGTGISKLLQGNKPKPTEIVTRVKAEAEVKKGEIPADRQPVMGAADIGKMSLDNTVFGWQEDENGKWYQNTDGTFFVSGWKEIDGSRYYFDENGYAVTDWLEIDGKDYFFDEQGRYDKKVRRPMIALTFDDGPGKYTEELIDFLVENDAKATFFMLGQNAEEYPEIVEKMEESGMELGNHTYSHQTLTTLSRKGIENEIDNANAAFEDAAGVPADTLRPPGGSVDENVQRAADMPIIKWSIDTKDWSNKDVNMIYEKVMDNAQDGSIVLMHDIYEETVKATMRMVPKLKEKGFRIVTVQELAEAREIELEDGKVYFYFGDGNQQVE